MSRTKTGDVKKANANARIMANAIKVKEQVVRQTVGRKSFSGDASVKMKQTFT